MNWYVYILKARTGRYYTGISNNPLERVSKHNQGKGARFAIQQGPLELKYVSKAFDSKSSARKREAQIKKWSRVKKEMLISGNWE